MSKHKSKNNNAAKSCHLADQEDLKIIDVTCPICLSIMIKPVTMPCNHSLCMICFELNVSKANLACPLCRKRISIWVRRTTKAKKLVDEKLWLKIQNRFKAEVDARLNGCDDPNNTFTSTLPPKRVADPGEIREEYELELKKVQEEEEALRQKEEVASKLVILALQEEDNHFSHEREAISEQDFEFAKRLRTSQLSETLNSLKHNKKSPQSQQKSNKKISQSQQKSNKKISQSQQKSTSGSNSSSSTLGPIDYFLEQLTPESKKRMVTQITPPTSQKKYSARKHMKKNPKSSIREFKWHNMQRTYSNEIRVPSAGTLAVFSSLGSSSSSTPSSSASSRVFKDITHQYSSESEAEFDSEENVTKSDKLKIKKFSKIQKNNGENDIHEEEYDYAAKDLERIENEENQVRCTASSSEKDDQNSQWTFLASELDKNNPDYEEKYLRLLEEQKAIEERLNQEKEDLRFALQLQKSFKVVNRSKGTADEYCLRNHAEMPSKRPRPSFDDSPSVSNCHLNKKRKVLRQTTLVESLTKNQRRV